MQPTEPNPDSIVSFSLVEMTKILIKHQDIHEGLYNLSLELKIAIGTIGPDIKSILPGAMIGVSRIGISKTAKAKTNVHTVDAAEVNPLPKKKK